MKLIDGELYFVGELDHHSGLPTNFVKIGIVRENENRDTLSRVADHQTGNPRRLVVHDVVKSPAVERIETLMHGVFAPIRVGGEWFFLHGSDVTTAVERAKVFASEAANATALAQKALELKDTPANGIVAAATEQSSSLAAAHGAVTAGLKIFQTIERDLRTLFSRLNDSGADVGRFLRVTVREATAKFDSKAFKEAHPDIWAEFAQSRQKMTGNFVLNAKASAPPDDLPSSRLAHIRESINTLVEQASTKGGPDLDAIHALYLDSVAEYAALEWQQDVLELEIKNLCGESSGVEDLCTWNRRLVDELKFDSTAFKAAHPELYESFVEMQKPVVAQSLVRDREYQF